MNKYQEQWEALEQVIQLLECDFAHVFERNMDYDDDAEHIMENAKHMNFGELKDTFRLNAPGRCIECRAREVIQFLKETQTDCYLEETDEQKDTI